LLLRSCKAESNPNMGYDAKTDAYKDMIEAGIIDPVKVVRTALQNASSNSGFDADPRKLLWLRSLKKKSDMPSMPGPESYMM